MKSPKWSFEPIKANKRELNGLWDFRLFQRPWLEQIQGESN